MGGGDVAHRRAPPSLVLEQVVVQQHQHLVGGDVVALLINDAQPVRVAVGGDAQVGMVIPHGLLQIHQGVRVGGGQMSAEEGVVAVVDGVNVAAGGVEDGHQARQAHAVHGIQHNARPAPADGRHVDPVHDGIQVGVPGINIDDLPFLPGPVEVNGADVLLRQGVGLLAHGIGDLLAGVPPAPGEQLDAVVNGRVVAGGHRRAVGQVHVLDGEHDLRRGGGQVDEVELHTLPRHHLGEPDGCLPAEEPPVIADAEALLGHALPVHAPGHRRRHPADIAADERIADHGAPAARAELNHVPHGDLLLSQARVRIRPAASGRRHGKSVSARLHALRVRSCAPTHIPAIPSDFLLHSSIAETGRMGHGRKWHFLYGLVQFCCAGYQKYWLMYMGLR